MVQLSSSLAVLLTVVLAWNCVSAMTVRRVISSVTPENRTLCPEDPQNRPSNRVNTTERLAALRSEMNRANVQAYIINNNDDNGRSRTANFGSAYYNRLVYMSGFSGSNGYAIVTQTEAALWTDGRYFTQADLQMDCNWILMKISRRGYPSSTEWLNKVLSDNSHVGAYPNYVSSATWREYEADRAKKHISVTPVANDLVDVIWTDPNRPSVPNNPLIVHPLELTGLSWKEKFRDVRAHMTTEDVGGLVVTSLEQIAWLFNLRGSDKSYSVFYSYAVLFHDSARLYFRNPATLLEDETVRQHLGVDANGACTTADPVNCIHVYDYNRAISDIASFSSSHVLWVDPSSNYAVYNAAGAKRRVADSPIELMKAIKNSVEQQHFEQCILRDSAAVVEFAAFLEKEINAGNSWTEMQASDKLEQIRSTDDYFKGVSFETISAFADNAAIIHYQPTPETEKQIDKTSVYLVDSGGQYVDGTTDVTRTFHYGTPSEIIKDAYTRVLMAQIELATTVWPAGLYGSEIDARARTPLWQNGWDYNHGTGHGIGYWLNVHEGPSNIQIGVHNKPLYEGMFLSDEPGYYEVGSFGIRLETLVSVVKANTKYRFGGKQFLTFKPLTLVPYEPHLINYTAMSSVHIAWLNEYHKRCEDEVGQYLLNRSKQEAYDWLVARTSPVPIISSSNSIGRRHSVVCLFVSSLVTGSMRWR